MTISSIDSVSANNQPLAKKLAAGLKALNIDLSAERQKKLLLYLDLLLRYAQPLGLTSLNDPLMALERHILDSLTPLPWLPDEGRLLDVGSGAGLPGIPLKIARDSLEVVLIEARRRRASFMTYALGVLDLKGIKVLRCHLGQDCPLKEETYEVVISRALSDLGWFVSLAWPYVAPNGWLVAMKGPEIRSELVSLSPALREKLSIKSLRLPFSGAKRTLIFIRK